MTNLLLTFASVAVVIGLCAATAPLPDAATAVILAAVTVGGALAACIIDPSGMARAHAATTEGE